MSRVGAQESEETDPGGGRDDDNADAKEGRHASAVAFCFLDGAYFRFHGSYK